MEEVAQALARKVAAVPERAPNVLLTWANNAALSEGQWGAFKQAFLDEIKSRGMVPAMDANGRRLEVTASATPVQVLFAAKLPVAEGEQVCIVALARSAVAAGVRLAAGIALQKDLLWQQSAPISDAVEWTDASSHLQFLLVLQMDSLVRLRAGGNSWATVDSAPLPQSPPRTRFPDGRLDSGGDGPRLSVSGAECDINLEPKLSLTCRRANNGGLIVLMHRLPCGAGAVTLAEGDEDWTRTDRIEIRLPDSPEPGAKVDGVDLPGPVISVSGQQNPRVANVVVWNLISGNYEVYRITIACGN